MVAPFKVTLYDPAFNLIGFVGAPSALTVTPRHLARPTAEITVPVNCSYADRLIDPTTRIVIDYLGSQVFSGPIGSVTGTAGPQGSLVIRPDSDWRILDDLLAWPHPTQPITSQGADDLAFDTKSGPAETVVKWFIGRAITRLGLPITVATDLGRGSTIKVSMRMDAPTDKLLPALEGAGIGISVKQGASGLVVDCYELGWYPLELSTQSGAVQDCEWTRTAPSMTRVVVGGGGSHVDRDFRVYVSASLEAQYGYVREGFVDASSTYGDASTARDRWVSAVGTSHDTRVALDLASVKTEKALDIDQVAQDAADTATTNYADSPTSSNLSIKNRTVSHAAVTHTHYLADVAATAVKQTAYDNAITAQATAYANLGTELTKYYVALDDAGAQALAAGAPKSGLRLTLAETPAFRYGADVRVGDLVTTRPVPGATPITEVLSEAVLTWTADDGARAVPVVGDLVDDPNRRLASFTARLARAVRINQKG